MGFRVLWGHSIDIWIFILYKLYILSPNPKPITENILHFYIYKKHHYDLVIYSLFSSRGVLVLGTCCWYIYTIQINTDP